MLSISDIVKIEKPIVWTLHDMWAFCGAEHYTNDERWKEGYQKYNRPNYESGFDLNRWTWERKKKYWKNSFHVVTPSTWLAKCVSNSNLMKNWTVSLIPYAIDTDKWKPLNKIMSRKKLNLPEGVNLILFGAPGGGKDPRKGYDLLLKSLEYMKIKNTELVIFGESKPEKNQNLKIPIHYMGDIFDDKILTLMDFNCDQKDSVHFFYLLPFSPKTALIETTWISRMDDARELNYSDQIHDYIKDVLKIGEYKINYSEIGKIPMFNTKTTKGDNIIQIGTAGGMTRLSTGYTFTNIQKQSSYIQKNIQSIHKLNNFSIRKKYQHLDNIFLSVLLNNSSKMIEVFYRMFGCKTDTIIKFLSEESTFSEDLAVIRSMPKKIFLSALIGK